MTLLLNIHVVQNVSKITSVVDSIRAPYRSNSSITLIRFFLQATCNGVKPFCNKPYTQTHAIILLWHKNPLYFQSQHNCTLLLTVMCSIVHAQMICLIFYISKYWHNCHVSAPSLDTYSKHWYLTLTLYIDILYLYLQLTATAISTTATMANICCKIMSV